MNRQWKLFSARTAVSRFEIAGRERVRQATILTHATALLVTECLYCTLPTVNIILPLPPPKIKETAVAVAIGGISSKKKKKK